MEKLYDLNELILTWSKKRKEPLKTNLHDNMQVLRRDYVEFTGTELFDDNFNVAIKKVTELNEVSNDLKGLSKFGFYYQSRSSSYGSFRSRGRYIGENARSLS